MADRELFFQIIEVPSDAENEAHIRVSAGETYELREGTQGCGDILMHLDPEMLNKRGVTGFLAFPERAEMEFEGTLEEMKALWMTTGAKRPFLRDSRFRFART